MDSTIEKEGNSLPHNTTEEQIKGILKEITNYDEYTGIEISNMIHAMKVYGQKRHNLALSQVLEKLEELEEVPDDFEGRIINDSLSRVKSIITSLQKE